MACALSRARGDDLLARGSQVDLHSLATQDLLLLRSCRDDHRRLAALHEYADRQTGGRLSRPVGGCFCLYASAGFSTSTPSQGYLSPEAVSGRRWNGRAVSTSQARLGLSLDQLGADS